MSALLKHAARRLWSWLISDVGQKSMSILHEHEGRDYFKAHQYSSGHRKQIESSPLCGCFYCLATFKPKEIREWIDNNEKGVGQTALCPECGIDSVIGSQAGFPLTKEFLSTMYHHWFEK